MDAEYSCRHGPIVAGDCDATPQQMWPGGGTAVGRTCTGVRTRLAIPGGGRYGSEHFGRAPIRPPSSSEFMSYSLMLQSIRRFAPLLLAPLAVLALSACGGSSRNCVDPDEPYLAARNNPGLKVPEGLSQPDRSAAELLAEQKDEDIIGVLDMINPLVAQQILHEFEDERRAKVIAAAPADLARRWEANQKYPEDSVGWLLEPAVAVFRPHMTARETIEAMRKLSKRAFITYGYVTDESNKLIGVLVFRDVMLADPDAAETRLECFACGADAFVVRPIEVRELAAQLRAIRRRIADTRAPEVADGHGGWGLAEGGWVLRDPRGNELPLTTAQRAFVLRLIEAGDQPVSRLALISSLGSNPRDADPHRVDVLVSRLRQKASALGMTLPLHSVRGQGYVFTIDPGRSERAEPAWSAPRREAARTAATRWKTDDFEYRA